MAPSLKKHSLSIINSTSSAIRQILLDKINYLSHHLDHTTHQKKLNLSKNLNAKGLKNAYKINKMTSK